jgi:hypothetical protein
MFEAREFAKRLHREAYETERQPDRVLDPVDPIRRAKAEADVPAPAPGDTPNGTANGGKRRTRR